MINFQINETLPESGLPGLDPNIMENAARFALEHAPQPVEGDLTLMVTGDEHIQQLNRDFLGTDAPTDVLSFPADFTDPDTEASYLGDVIISYPRAQEQARAAGYPIEVELQILVVHGVLHLLGYDHAEPVEKAKMWAVQNEVLAQLGIDSAHMPL